VLLHEGRRRGIAREVEQLDAATLDERVAGAQATAAGSWAIGIRSC